MAIELLNESSSKVDEAALISIAQYAIVEMGLSAECDLEISIADEDEMSELHIAWMDLEGPTDVLSFPIDELEPHTGAEGLIGTIVLCPTFAAAEIARQGFTHPVADELLLLTVHGVLHCIGYDHRDADEEKVMFGIQNKIVSDWKAKQ